MTRKDKKTVLFLTFVVIILNTFGCVEVKHSHYEQTIITENSNQTALYRTTYIQPDGGTWGSYNTPLQQQVFATASSGPQTYTPTQSASTVPTVLATEVPYVSQSYTPGGYGPIYNNPVYVPTIYPPQNGPYVAATVAEDRRYGDYQYSYLDANNMPRHVIGNYQTVSGVIVLNAGVNTSKGNNYNQLHSNEHQKTTVKTVVVAPTSKPVTPKPIAAAQNTSAKSSSSRGSKPSSPH